MAGVNKRINPPLKAGDKFSVRRPSENPNRDLEVDYAQLLKDIISAIPLPPGSAAWGTIAPGTGVASQADLVAYLTANYITASDLITALIPYVDYTTLAGILTAYVPTSTTITINGVTYDLSTDRTWTISGGSAAWGSIGTGTGVGSQADLVAYLIANYYPLSTNPASYITAAVLGGILAAYVGVTRTITINGVTYDLSADRTWTIPATAWGGIGAGSGVGSQADLVAYLAANYYPLAANPASYVTSSVLAGVLASYVPYSGATGSLTMGAFNVTAAKLNTTAAAAMATPATLFAVVDSGEIKTRTPAQVLSDIGAASSTGVPFMCMQESYPVATNQSGILYVPSAGKIYVCNISSNSVSIINISTGVVSTLSVTGAFQAFYIASINEVWVTSNSLTTINRISVSLNTLLTAMTGATINGTDYVEVSSTSVLICNNNATGSISPVNPSTLTIGAAITLNVPANPQGMALNTNVASSQYNKIVISAGAGVAIFDPTINVITTTVTNPSSAISSGSRIRYITSTNQYILANFGSSNILVLDIASATTFTLNSTIRNLPGVLDVAVDETTGYVFTCVTGLTSAAVLFVSIIDLATKKVVNTLATNVLSGSATTSGRIALDASNKKYYVCGRSSNTNVVTTIKYV